MLLVCESCAQGRTVRPGSGFAGKATGVTSSTSLPRHSPYQSRGCAIECAIQRCVPFPPEQKHPKPSERLSTLFSVMLTLRPSAKTWWLSISERRRFCSWRH